MDSGSLVAYLQDLIAEFGPISAIELDHAESARCGHDIWTCTHVGEQTRTRAG